MEVRTASAVYMAWHWVIKSSSSGRQSCREGRQYVFTVECFCTVKIWVDLENLSSKWTQWYIIPVLTLTSEFLCFTHNDNVKLYLLEHSRAQLKYTTKVIIRKKSTQLRGILLYFISGPHKHYSRVHSPTADPSSVITVTKTDLSIYPAKDTHTDTLPLTSNTT